ncbi:hypothetical protein CSB11_00010 [Candidatus Campbellbacteria bacterium]|nr:MAG: hypothetical protein CSB11_00010 [Candidatus Campbellbacteria bacterium]
MLNFIQKLKNSKTASKLKSENFKLGFKKFKKELLENKNNFWIFFICVFLLGLADALFPYFTGKIVDSITDLEKIDFLGYEVYSFYVVLGIFLSIRFLGNLLGVYFELYFLKNISNEIYKKYKKNYFKVISKYPVSFFKNNPLGRITYLSDSAANNIARVVFTTNNLLSAVFFLIASLFFVALISYKVLGVVLFFAVVNVAYFYSTVKKRVFLTKQLNDVQKNISSFITEKINFLIEIKKFNKEKKESLNINNKFDKNYEKKFIDKRNFHVKNSIIIAVLFQIMFLSIYLFVFYLFLQNELTAGEVISVVMYSGWIVRNNNFILREIAVYIDSFTIVGDAEKILKNQKENYSKGKTRVKNLKGDIEFKEVSFEYESRKDKDQKEQNDKENEDKKEFSLNNLNIKIQQGQKVAFVGQSGSGKTTSVDLIGAFLYPQKGEVLIDGVKTNKINLNDLRKNIAYVSQDISIFNTTVKENIAYGSLKKVTDAEIVKSAKNANIDGFISRLKDGYKTNVGEKGLKLSGGQKQRISIARAFLKNPKILILDEPTSALDIESEKKVTQSLETLMKDKTTIIIAHRLSTIKNVDKIFVFKNGSVVESGSYKELVEKKGEFYKMVKMHLEFSQI